VVMAAVDIGLRPGSNAGVAFFLLRCDESKGASRPKAKPTEDVPTTVAVAQSVGIVFILVGNQAAGERSLVEALVTTCRALWHVRVPVNQGSRAARVGTVGVEGLNQALGQAYCITKRSKGRTAQAPRRAEAERWSSTRSERKTEENPVLVASGIYVQGYPALFGLARCRR
jgi:hypothetical protein